jgi:hypothetical protein
VPARPQPCKTQGKIQHTTEMISKGSWTKANRSATLSLPLSPAWDVQAVEEPSESRIYLRALQTPFFRRLCFPRQTLTARCILPNVFISCSASRPTAPGSGLIIPLRCPMPRVRPAIEAGLRASLEARMPFMRPLLEPTVNIGCAVWAEEFQPSSRCSPMPRPRCTRERQRSGAPLH